MVKYGGTTMNDHLQALRVRARDAKREWLLALEDPMGSQRRLLLESCVRPNVETVFGREHGFAHILDEHEYRRRVPIRDYAALAPYIDRAAVGEKAVLTAEDPVAFNLTSGTMGPKKLIPSTRSFAERFEVPRILATLGNIFEYHPELLDRDDTTLNFLLSPFDRPAPPPIAAAAPQLPLSSRRRASPALLGTPGTMAPWSTAPPAVTDHASLTYFRLRTTVESDLRAFFSINPSTLTTFADELIELVPRLCEELRAGTMLGAPGRPSNPARAAEIESIVKQRGALRPIDLWPRISVISCWTAGACALYLPAVRAAYGDSVDFVRWASNASEGPLEVPIDREPAGPPAVQTVFYEFIAADTEVKSDTPTLLLDQLEDGKQYEVIITQSAGLYRYTMRDIVEVIGRYRGVPRLEFKRRRGSAHSFTGEKLTEHHVARSTQAALEACNLAAVTVTCCPVWGTPPSYAFLFEPTRPWTDAEQRSLVAALDRELAASNVEWTGKRETNRIGSPTIIALSEGTFRRYRDRRIAGGESAVQLKDHALQVDPSVLAQLLALSQPR